MFLRNNYRTIRIANKKLKLYPMNARHGLDAVLIMSKYLSSASHYLAALSDNSAKVRAITIVKMLNEISGFDEFIINMVALGTGTDKSELETTATFAELMSAFNAIWELNKWDEFWKVAYSIRLVEEKTWLLWNFTEVKKLKRVR